MHAMYTPLIAADCFFLFLMIWNLVGPYSVQSSDRFGRAIGGSVWLHDEKSAVVQEPSVILPSEEYGPHLPGFRPLSAHTVNDE